jgi:hypothetical protein
MQMRCAGDVKTPIFFLFYFKFNGGENKIIKNIRVTLVMVKFLFLKKQVAININKIEPIKYCTLRLQVNHRVH